MTVVDAYGQLFENSITEFNQFFQNYGALNSASEDTIKLKILVGNRTFTGLFEGVNRFYIDGVVKLKNKGTSQFSKLGIQAFRFNDGPFINRSRVYGRYSWSGRLGLNSSLSGGVGIGLINYYFTASQFGGGGSSTVIDANAGIWYLRRQLKIGLSYNQFTSSVLKPVNQLFSLKPYWNTNLVYTIDFNHQISLTTHLYYHLLSNFNQTIQIAPILNFYQYLVSGVNYQHNNGVAFIFGFQAIPIMEGKLQFLGSFFLRTKRLGTSADNVIEITGGYAF